MPSSSEDKSRLVSRESIDGDKCNQDFMMCPGGGHSFGDDTFGDETFGDEAFGAGASVYDVFLT